MNRLKRWFNSYSDELMHRVTWPTADQLQKNTVTVLIASIMLAIVMGLMDLVFKNAMVALFSLIN